MRVLQGGHDVPNDKLVARFPRTQANLTRAIHSLPHVLVYDNSDLASPFRQVGEFRRGQAGQPATAAAGLGNSYLPAPHDAFRNVPFFIAEAAEGESVEIAFALVTYCEDRDRVSPTDLKQHDIASAAERDDEFAKKWAVPATAGLPTGEGKVFEHGQRLVDRVHCLCGQFEVLFQQKAV